MKALHSVLFVSLLVNCTGILAQESSQLMVERGSEKYRKGKYSEAIQYFSRAIEKDSNSSAAYIYRAISFDASDDFGRALVDFNKARQLDSNDIFVFAERAQTFLNLKEFDAAALDFSKILELSPNGKDAPDAYYFLGRICFKQAKYEQAINYYTRVLKFRPNDSEIFLLRGEAKFFLGDFRSATKDLDFVIEKDAENGYAYFLRGSCSLQFGSQDEACKDLRKAIKNDYEKAKTLYSRTCLGK